MRRLLPIGLLCASIAGPVLLGGCGGGDEPSSTSPPAERTDPPAMGFEDTSGATDIPAFGFEADAAQRAAAEVSLNGYLKAVGREDWSAACALLAISTGDELKALLETVREARRKTCEEALRLSLARGHAYESLAKVAALRIKVGGAAGRGAGFALFHGTDGTDYWMTMKLEGSGWRVSGIAPQVLGAGVGSDES